MTRDFSHDMVCLNVRSILLGVATISFSTGCSGPLFSGGLPVGNPPADQRRAAESAPSADAPETERDSACAGLNEPCQAGASDATSSDPGTKTPDGKKAPTVVKTSWTLVYPDARRFRTYMIGCAGTTAYFYKNPTPDDVKKYRTGILKFLKEKAFTTYDVWAGDLKDQLHFYSVAVDTGTVKDLGEIVFGGPALPVICKCDREDKGQTCSDSQTPYGEPFSASIEVTP